MIGIRRGVVVRQCNPWARFSGHEEAADSTGCLAELLLAGLRSYATGFLFFVFRFILSSVR
jgi:hypothetical protein